MSCLRFRLSDLNPRVAVDLHVDLGCGGAWPWFLGVELAVQQLHCAKAATSCPPVTPRTRDLIGPIPASRACTTPSRSISSPPASTPAVAVNDGSGAPNRTPRRARFRPRHYAVSFSPRGCLPVRSNHGLSNRDCSIGTGTLVTSHADCVPQGRHYSRIHRLSDTPRHAVKPADGEPAGRGAIAHAATVAE